MIHSFFTTFFAVFLAELGDKTQILALLLIVRFKKHMPVMLGIIVAAFLSQFLAGAVGVGLRALLTHKLVHICVGISFIAGGAMCLLPQKEEEIKTITKHSAIFITVAIAFFIAELGDKTQLLTTALAAKYNSWFLVPIAASLGLIVVNLPVVCFGHNIEKIISVKVINYIASGIFLLAGVWMLIHSF